MKKAIILLSGGLDSTTCLAYAKAAQFDCYALSFRYGQKHTYELEVAQKIATHYETPLQIIELPLGQWGKSALTHPDIDIPQYQGGEDIAPTYVPARNTLFLAFALSYAESLQAHAIFIGISSIDYSGYPDCRPEYLKAFQKMATLATETGVKGKPIIIQAPLLHLSKAQTVHLGTQLGVDYSMTISCYQTDNNGFACGSCDSCTFRKKGFEEAGIPDPTRYR